jgi:hypothetical protein
LDIVLAIDKVPVVGVGDARRRRYITPCSRKSRVDYSHLNLSSAGLIQEQGAQLVELVEPSLARVPGPLLSHVFRQVLGRLVRHCVGYVFAVKMSTKMFGMNDVTTEVVVVGSQTIFVFQTGQDLAEAGSHG